MSAINPSEPSSTKPALDPLAATRRAARSFTLKVALVWIAIFACGIAGLSIIRLNLTFVGEWWRFIVYGEGTQDVWTVGVITTLFISVVSILGAVVLAFVSALGRLSKNPLAYGMATFYVSLIRGTPLIVQIFILYFGLPQINQQLAKLIPNFEQTYPFISNLLLLPALPTGIAALAINYGAYMTEVFRAGIQSIGIGQTEAARALGMTPSQTMWRIILPQAIRVIIPPVGNDFIAMTKDSALVSVIGVQELLWRAQKVGVQYFHSMETLLIAAAFYWILTILLQSVQSRIEQYMARGDRGSQSS
jgi:polar amino acid transport system permease protein